MDGVQVPYHAAWRAETDDGKRLGLSPWAEQQAAKYGVSVTTLRAAVAADWTRQGRERDAKRAQVRADFQQRHGAELREVANVLNRLRRAYEAAVVSELARRHGISNPRMRSWGPAGSGLGIHGYIDGEPVLLLDGVLYRGEERPHHSLDN